VIVVRDVFRLRFGEARRARAVWKEGLEIGRRNGVDTARLLVDAVGRYYTLVLELTFPDLSAYEEAQRRLMASEEWRAWYPEFVPLAESGYREILQVVE
jgi:hypothetical protein